MPILTDLYKNAQNPTEMLQSRWVMFGLTFVISAGLSATFANWMAYSFYMTLGAGLSGGIVGLGLYQLGQAAFDTYRKVHQILDHIDQTIVNTNKQITKLGKAIDHLNTTIINANTKIDALGDTLSNADETLIHAQRALGNVQDATAPFSLPSRATKGFLNYFTRQPAYPDESDDEDLDEDLDEEEKSKLRQT